MNIFHRIVGMPGGMAWYRTLRILVESTQVAGAILLMRERIYMSHVTQCQRTPSLRIE